jgi:hypothetical protein
VGCTTTTSPRIQFPKDKVAVTVNTVPVKDSGVIKIKNNDVIKIEDIEKNPLVPLTQDIIDRAKKEGMRPKDIQYYISTPLTLEKTTKDEYVRINKGDVLSDKKYNPVQIQIGKETKGTITALGLLNKNDPNSYYLEICFDNDDTNKTLRFKKNSTGTQFDLVYENPEKIFYGGEPYQITMIGNNPHLLIKYKEEVSSYAITQRATGRDISK